MLNDQPTISDAAMEFKVSAKTVRDWIKKGVIPEPPSMQQGLRDVLVFPDSYMEQAKQQLNRHLAEKRRKRTKRRKGG